MRKKIILRLLLLTAFMALLWSCQQELQQAEQEYDAQLQKNTVEWLSRAQLEKNHPQVLDKINQISPNTASENNKIYTDAENEFSIDTDEAYLVKDGNGTTTYTFKIKRDSEKDEGSLENLILKDIGDGNFFAYFITYDAAALSNSREKPLSSEELSRHISLYAVGKKTSAEIFGKLNSCPMVFYPVGTYVYVSGHQCIEGLHDYGEPCAYLGTSNAATQGGYEVVYNMTVQETPGSCGGSGSGGGMGTTPVYGGGGGNINLPELNDPCEKTKAIVTKPQIKDSLTALKAHAQTNTKKERGFQEFKSGSLVKGNVHGDNLLEFGIGSNSLGTVHTHQPKTIGILAPQDVMTFLHIVRQQDPSSLGNAYSGTVSSSGTYFINFTGTVSDLPPAMTEAQEKAYVADLVKAYKEWEDVLSEDDRYSIDYLKVNKPQGLEILFFKLLKKMNLNDKVQLIKEENGNTATIKENTNGTTTPNPC
ncbi:hypothetical protein NZD88_15995 [Chryseobacterium antibioticum]|uniref:Lipoprotein n=1 Tax=Chryseobacterium pyrolae TaxID=2987481 RepID=A0ABT2IK66_9FLAO|nr:hypothetical protein [Chryseobacterium pyrolae]MCT2409050.1 hypothetical protein [Chryseobacterium pyrolae]